MKKTILALTLIPYAVIACNGTSPYHGTSQYILIKNERFSPDAQLQQKQSKKPFHSSSKKTPTILGVSLKPAEKNALRATLGGNDTLLTVSKKADTEEKHIIHAGTTPLELNVNKTSQLYTIKSSCLASNSKQAAYTRFRIDQEIQKIAGGRNVRKISMENNARYQMYIIDDLTEKEGVLIFALLQDAYIQKKVRKKRTPKKRNLSIIGALLARAGIAIPRRCSYVHI